MPSIIQTHIGEIIKATQEEEAKEIGIKKVALNMLSQNLNPLFIAKCTGLTIKQINKLESSTEDSKDITSTKVAVSIFGEINRSIRYYGRKHS